LGLIGSAVLTLIGYKQTDSHAKFIYRLIIVKSGSSALMLIGKHFFSLSRVQVFLLSISLVNWQLIKQIGINEDFNDLKKI